VTCEGPGRPYSQEDEDQIQRELRPPPSDQIWMETEQIGVSERWVWLFIAAFGLAMSLVIVLPLVLT
jgi:hypothetical protein